MFEIFGKMNLKSETPKMTLVNKVLSSSSKSNCDSPFRLMPNVSTPPSRFAKIFNPFEPYMIERLHLPTFSPNVFAQVSTPKEKFKWTIDEISSLKPADIDEGTISQHVSDHDPTVESMVQERIETFFKEKIMVPSPMVQSERTPKPLIAAYATPPRPKPQVCDSSAQTVLTLPPTLPPALEELLKPYFTYTEDQSKNNDPNVSLYRKLFEFDENDDEVEHNSLESSPPLSTGLSPIPLSPIFINDKTTDENSSPQFEKPEFKDCSLSPIGRNSRLSRSACRLSFSGHMSIDNSMIVPDLQYLPNHSNGTIYEVQQGQLCSLELMDECSSNWDMEYKRVSILTTPPPNNQKNVDCTPQTRKIFCSSQPKRLSDSFKDEEYSKDIDMLETDFSRRSRGKFIMNDYTDTGYCTGEGSTWDRTHMFASTPSKHHD